MCTCRTATRRRAQAKNKYRHIAKLRRPKYAMSEAHISARRLQKVVEKQKAIAMRKGMSKK